MSNLHATVVGAGLAGSEAAWQLARQGIAVTLIEMKPEKMSPAHHSPLFAELVLELSAQRSPDERRRPAEGRNAPDALAGDGSG